MRRINGIADATRRAAIDSPGYSVTIIDGESLIELNIGNGSFPAGLTPDQARCIAKELTHAAFRVENNQKVKK